MTTEISTQRSVPMNELAANGEQAVKTGMLPDHIKTGWQFAVIAATGHELGMQPMRAIRSLAMVKGKVVESADSQLARFKAAGGRSQFEVLDETKAVLHLIHPNGDKHTETFTLEDAKRAGLASNSNYSKFPKAMLRSRAITAGLKSIGWEGAVGAYDPDEIRSDEFPDPAPLTKAVNEAAPGITVHHVKTFEPGTVGAARQTIGWLDRVNACTTVQQLGQLGDDADHAASMGEITAQQRKRLDAAINRRHVELEPEDTDVEHFDAQEIEAEAHAHG